MIVTQWGRHSLYPGLELLRRSGQRTARLWLCRRRLRGQQATAHQQTPAVLCAPDSRSDGHRRVASPQHGDQSREACHDPVAA